MIIKLQPNVIKQIAAGEVVEGPYSVIKELVENSIDANATHIIITIEDAGKKLIMVEDNGAGIPKDDIIKAFDTHTTSKITNISDIYALDTLGFRGEALSSIASISKVNIITKTENETEAYQLIVENGKASEIVPTSRSIGTTIEVQDLFANIPARLKYLRSNRTEYKRILQIINRLALINPKIRFTLINNGKEIFDYKTIDIGKTDSFKSIHPQRTIDIMNDLKTEDLIPVHLAVDNLIIGGYVAHPRLAGEKYPETYVYVNNRSIIDRGIVKSVLSGANRFIPTGKRLPLALSIIINPKYVDINIHPRKEEVRFDNPYRIFSAIESAVRKGLVTSLKEEYISDQSTTETSQNTGVYRLREGNSPYSHDNSQMGYGSYNSGNMQRSSDALDFTKQLLDEETMNKYLNSEFKNIRQYLNRYIICEKNNELLIIDQHAAAERVRFESLLKNYQDKQSIRQQLLVPVKIKLSSTQIALLSEMKTVLQDVGFEFTTNKSQVIITAVPESTRNGNIEKMFIEVISDSTNPKDIELIVTEKYESIIATLACHTSLRANQAITDKDVIQLVENLFKCQNSYSCPHGRPIIWKLTKNEIDKKFDRI